jgi:hypothetical protein
LRATSLDLFAYLAAFVSVVLALAVSDLLQSLHRLIRARKRVRWSLTAILAAGLVFLAILEEFFGLGGSQASSGSLISTCSRSSLRPSCSR